MPTEINFYKKNEENEWLSNFYESPQTIDGITYPTNEHYYQSQKSKDPKTREWIASSSTPREAKNRGNAFSPLREDWDTYKIHVMYKGIQAKFENPELRQKLLDTCDAILHEDSPTDMVWGKRGKDLLGKVIMLVREEIKKEILKNDIEKLSDKINKMKSEMGIATRESYEKMWDKIDGMELSELQAIWKCLNKIPYNPREIWQDGITMEEWAQEVYAEINRRVFSDIW